jgi:hypothetical protein
VKFQIQRESNENVKVWPQMYADRLYITFFPCGYLLFFLGPRVNSEMIPKIHVGLNASRTPPPPPPKFRIFTKRSELLHGAALEQPNSAQTLNLFLLVHTANSTLPVTLPAVHFPSRCQQYTCRHATTFISRCFTLFPNGLCQKD